MTPRRFLQHTYFGALARIAKPNARAQL